MTFCRNIKNDCDNYRDFANAGERHRKITSMIKTPFS